MTVALLAGAVFGLGVLLLVAGMRPARVTIAGRLAEVDAAQWAAPPAAARDGVTAAAGSALRRWGARRGWPSPVLRSDLALLGLDVESLCVRKLAWSVAGFLCPAVFAVVVVGAGLPMPMVVPLWAAIAGAAVGFLLPDVRIRQAAAVERRAVRSAVGAFLDLVAMRMASGAGLAEALTEAAQIGQGRAFRLLRAALADARTDGMPLAVALGRLGDRLAVPDLVDTGARLSLVDSTGAQAQVSLQAQAASLRDRELSEVQGRANERSQSMLVAQVVLGLGFVVFLGYPAVSKVLAT